MEESKEREEKKRKVGCLREVSFMEMWRNMLEKEAKEDEEKAAREQENAKMEEEDMRSRQFEERMKRAMVMRQWWDPL